MKINIGDFIEFKEFYCGTGSNKLPVFRVGEKLSLYGLVVGKKKKRGNLPDYKVKILLENKFPKFIKRWRKAIFKNKFFVEHKNIIRKT